MVVRAQKSFRKMLDSVLTKLGLPSLLSLVILLHGVAAAVFATVFLIEAFGWSFPLFSLGWQHPLWIHSPYTRSASAWIAVAIATFAVYEIFVIPWLPPTRKLKLLFFLYHLPWCVVVTYCAAQPGSDWSAWIDLPVMYGFTVLGAIAPTSAPKGVVAPS